jgi:D-serine deaminase-like pyridoxal phosphate-dependent protein
MTALAQRIAREFGTPAVVIDLDRVERNIARVQAACEAAGVANRPPVPPASPARRSARPK